MTSIAGPVRYRERLGRFWIWVGPAAILLGVAALALGIAADADEIAGASMPLLIVGFLAAITAWSIERYSAIEIDDWNLRVGRYTVPLADIERVLTADELPDDVLGRANSPLPTSSPGGRLLGGGWGLGLRLRPVGLALAGQAELGIVGSTDPEALVAHLRGYGAAA